MRARIGLPDVGVTTAALLGAGLRLAAAPVAPGTFDEVGFTAALTRFDLLSFEPHFPGYPLAVLLARAAAALGASAPYAAAAAALSVVAALALHAAAGRGWGGLLAGGLVALAPAAVLVGSRATSDGVALGLLGTAGAALAVAARPRSSPAWSGLAGVLLAATAAAKPDLALFLSALALARSRRAALAGAAPVLASAVVVLLPGVGGWAPLAHEALRFTGGHLGDWGGGVLAASTSAPRPLLAAAPLAEAAGAHGAVGSVVTGGLLAALALRAPRAARRAAVVACLPYALWLLLGQNLAAPRHALPLLVPAALLAGLGLPRTRTGRGLQAALVAALITGAAAGAARAVTEHRARGRLVDALEAVLDAEGPGLRLYAGGEARALAWRRPALDVRRARSVEHVLQQLAADPFPPARVWVVSTVDGADALPCDRDLGPVRLLRVPRAAPGGR